MKLLLILFLLTCCTKKVEQKETSTESIDILEMASNALASYENGLDIVLVESSLSSTLFKRFKEPVELDYFAIYWDQKNHHYYHASLEKYPRQIVYTLDSNLQQEPLLIEEFKEFIGEDAPLLYVGSTSPLKRIYINPRDKSIYLKKLTPLDDTLYADERDSIKTNNTPIFPVAYLMRDEEMDNPPFNTSYTNANIYARYPRYNGQLVLEKENTSIDEYLQSLAPIIFTTMFYPEEKFFE
ncbi:MAG: hypothetical protein ACRCY4_04985 [Brevinema sp.]